MSQTTLVPPQTRRIAIGVEYLGSSFNGWQFQGHNTNTIQNHVQNALGFVANEPIKLHYSGRTDSGVHALEQVCHFDTQALRTPFSWRQGVNSQLPRDVRVRWAEEVSMDFHSRYTTSFRDYIYLIDSTPVASAIFRQQMTWCRQVLDLEAMQEAATYFKGEHDFSAFRATGCQAKHPVRRMLEVDLWQKGNILAYAVRGNAFLYHMVRNMVGSLLIIGRGEQKPQWIKELLQQKNRHKAGATAAADGLYLRAIHYPVDIAPKAQSQRQVLSPFGLFDDELKAWPKRYDWYKRPPRPPRPQNNEETHNAHSAPKNTKTLD